jgi:hypothetical protein
MPGTCPPRVRAHRSAASLPVSYRRRTRVTPDAHALGSALPLCPTDTSARASGHNAYSRSRHRDCVGPADQGVATLCAARGTWPCAHLAGRVVYHQHHVLQGTRVVVAVQQQGPVTGGRAGFYWGGEQKGYKEGLELQECGGYVCVRAPLLSDDGVGDERCSAGSGAGIELP